MGKHKVSICKTKNKFIVKFEINESRQNMIDGWPQDVNDSAAKLDWDWNPQHNLEAGLSEYLIPEITKMYEKTTTG